MQVSNTHINYIEFKSNNLAATKKFYSNCFGWEFTDYGPNYTAFDGSGVSGGFELTTEPIQKGVLVVLANENLEGLKATIISENGTISVDTFSFPGGERFQFLDPSGNELAVWREVKELVY